MGWDGSSHIGGRYVYRFLGSEYITVTDSSSLDITGSFTLSFLIKPEPATRLTYAILSKGDPTVASTGSIYFESINGFLRVYLHSSNGTNSLVYDTTNAILNTNQIIQISVVWNFTTKTLQVYKNAVLQSIQINTSSGTFYNSASSMTTINTNNSAFEFGRATGKANFVGRVYDILYSGRDWSSLEISDYYDSIKYVGSYPSLGTIVFTSDRLGGSQLFTMKEDGTDQTFFYSNGASLRNPCYSNDGTKIAFCDNIDIGTSNNLYVINADGSSSVTLRAGILYGGYPTWNTTSTQVWFQDYISSLSNVGWTNADGSGGYGYYVSASPTGNNVQVTGDGLEITSQGAKHCSLSPDGTKLFVQTRLSSTTHYLYRFTVNTSTKQLSNRILIDSNTAVANATNPTQQVVDYLGTRVSPNNLYVGYSRRNVNNGTYQVWTRNIDGSNAQIVVPSSTINTVNATTPSHYFMGFSPDSTKILFSSNMSGAWQIYIADLDCSNIYNISNNVHNDTYANWKA